MDFLKKLSKMEIALYSFIGIVFIVIVVMVVNFVSKPNKPKTDPTSEVTDNYSEAVPMVSPEVIVEYVEKEKIVEVEKTITADMVMEDLNEMGVLVTAEYAFTEVEDYTKTRTVAKFFTTESNVLYSYDGNVTAGIDFSKIQVEADDEAGIMHVTIPNAAILQTDIDFDSFKLYEEKEGLWNPIGMEDFNESLSNFEKNAEKKAKDSGILEKAEKQAAFLVENFVRRMVDEDKYSIEVEVHEPKSTELETEKK